MGTSPVNLERLYREVGPSVWDFVRRRSRDTATAEELFQDTFLAAAKRPEALAVVRSERAWLLGIARNLVRERGRRRSPQLMASMEELPAGDTDEPLGPVEEMREAIRRLPEGQREVLELRLAQGLTYEEIAEALDIPIGTVRSRTHHAVAALRAWAKDAAFG